jgi:hypothetical protein
VVGQVERRGKRERGAMENVLDLRSKDAEASVEDLSSRLRPQPSQYDSVESQFHPPANLFQNLTGTLPIIRRRLSRHPNVKPVGTVEVDEGRDEILDIETRYSMKSFPEEAITTEKLSILVQQLLSYGSLRDRRKTTQVGQRSFGSKEAVSRYSQPPFQIPDEIVRTGEVVFSFLHLVLQLRQISVQGFDETIARSKVPAEVSQFLMKKEGESATDK